jgi:uncharacterized protein (TIGR03435 family)
MYSEGAGGEARRRPFFVGIENQASPLRYMMASGGEMKSVRALLVCVSLGGTLISQTEAHPEFEVASIKPTGPGAVGIFILTTPGGRVNITNMTLKDLICQAWRIQPYQVSGGPKWSDSARYDITAKPDHNPKKGEIPIMLQSLLTDRFHLVIRRETKELPIYALVMANKDGRLGPGLTESKEGSCTQPDPSKPDPPSEPGKPPARLCGSIFTQQVRQVRAVSVPLARLTSLLGFFLGRPVVDKTGLNGEFDIDLKWTPDETQAMRLPDELEPPASDGPGDAIFAAIQKQLGLKLRSEKGPVETFVIERAEEPSEN